MTRILGGFPLLALFLKLSVRLFLQYKKVQSIWQAAGAGNESPAPLQLLDEEGYKICIQGSRDGLLIPCARLHPSDHAHVNTVQSLPPS